MPTIRKRGDKFQVQVRRQGQKGISKTFYTFKDAQVWARQAEAKADRGGLEYNRSTLKLLTLGELTQRYKAEIVPTKRSAEVELIVLKAFLRHPICKKKLSNITPADFASYRDERLKTITAKSLKRQLSPIHNMF